MTVSVGDQIDNGKAIVVSVDENNLVVWIVVPPLHSQTGEPLTIMFKPSVAIATIEALLGATS